MKTVNDKAEKIDVDDTIEACQAHIVHQNLVDKAIKDKPSDEMIDDLSNLFKVLGDQTRIKIIYSLIENEVCVCDIAETISMTQSAVSHQLRVLKQARLVKFRKEGKTVFYSLDDEHVNKIFDFGLSHIKEMYY